MVGLLVGQVHLHLLKNTVIIAIYILLKKVQFFRLSRCWSKNLPQMPYLSVGLLAIQNQEGLQDALVRSPYSRKFLLCMGQDRLQGPLLAPGNHLAGAVGTSCSAILILYRWPNLNGVCLNDRLCFSLCVFPVISLIYFCVWFCCCSQYNLNHWQFLTWCSFFWDLIIQAVL